MTTRSRSGPLWAGIILMSIGAIFLIETWFGSVSIFRILARYWPVILIVVGLKKLYLYFTWEEEVVPPIPDTNQPVLIDSNQKE
jgi:hypothetical protein